MEVLTRDQAISSHTEKHLLPEGLSIDEMLAAVKWDTAMRDYTVVMINGHEITPDYWRSVKPKPGTQLMVAIRPAGGGGGGGGSGKQILTAVAAIAIMVVAIYAAPLIAGAIAPSLGIAAGGSGMAALTAGITAGIGIAGTLAMSAFVRPPRLASPAVTQNPDTGSAPAENSLYGISGGANAIARYGVVPKLFGRARLTPNMAADPYVISAGPVQTLRLLLDFGYAPLLIEDIRIGTTPISDFPTARYRIHTWFGPGSQLEIYTRDNSTLSVGAELGDGTEVIRQAPQAGKVIYLDIGFPGGLAAFDRNGNIGNKDEYLHIQFRNPGGTWANIGDYPHWAWFGGDSGASVSGERQIASQVVGIAQRSSRRIAWSAVDGEQPQIGDFVRWGEYEYQITGISPANNDRPPDVEFTAPTNWLTLSADLPGWIDWNWYGDWSWNPGFDRPAPVILRRGYTAAVGPIVAEFGPSPWDVHFIGRSRAARTLTIAFEAPWVDSWEVRVYRATPLSADPLISNRMSWTSFRSEKTTAPIAPVQYRTIMELEIAATEQVNGQVQNINALVTAYNWDWRDGQWKPLRSPAFAYVDLLTTSANKNKITHDMIDLPKIQQWADWCWKTSPQGDMNATCDLLIESRTTVSEVAQAICASGRAMPAMINGKYSVIMDDEPRVPVQMFTNRNTRSITTSRVWADEPHAVKVRYLSEVNWERDEVIVYMDGYDAMNATKFENLDLVGTTRPWQAWRMGRYYLAQARLRKEIAKVDTDIENLVCQRGDLVRVGHDHLLNSEVARIMKVTGNTLQLDSYLELTGDLATIDEYDFRTGTMPNGVQFARSTIAQTWNGSSWSEVAIDVPRWSLDGGLIVEPPRTNWIRNARSIGAVLGPISTVGRLPTNWSHVAGRGHLIEIVQIANEQGVDRLRMRITGTGNANAGSPTQLAFELQGFINAVPGDTFTFSVFMRLLDETLPPLSVGLGVSYRLANGTTAVGEAVFVPLPLTAQLERYEITVTVPNDPTIARAMPFFGVQSAVGLAIDLTVDVGWPQFETGEFASSPMIAPAPAANVQQQRLADRITMTFAQAGIPDNGRSTIALIMLARPRDGTDQILLELDNGTNDNRIAIIDRDSSNHLDLLVTTGGVEQRVQIGYFDPTQDVEVVLEVDGFGTATAQFRNGPQVSLGGAPTSGLNTLRISDAAAGATRAAGVVRNLQILAGALPTSALGVQLRTAAGGITNPAPLLAVVSPDEIAVDPATAAMAAPGDLIAVGRIGATLTDWLVDAISPGADLSASLSLIEYRPEVNFSDRAPIPPYVPPNSDRGGPINLGPVRTPVILIGQGYEGPVTINSVKVDWNPPDGYLADNYIVERIFLTDVRTLLVRTDDTFVVDSIPAITVPTGGAPVTYFITPVTRRGLRGPTAVVTATVYPDTTIPIAPVLTANVLGNSTRLFWTPSPSPDVASYQIRWNSDFGNTNWNQMQILIETVAASTNNMMVHTRSGVYAIRAVDYAGNWSAVSFVRTLVEVPQPVDASYTIKGPSWAGGKFTNTELDANGNIVLKKNTSGQYFAEGHYEFPTPLTLLQVWKVRAETSLVMDVFPSPDTLTVQHDAQIMMQIAKNLPLLNSAWFNPLQKAIPLAGDPTNFAAWNPVVAETIEGQIFWSRITLRSKDGIHTPVVKSALIDIYFDPRSEAGNDVPATGGVLQVTYRYPFVQTPGLQITLNNGDKDDYIIRTQNTNTGFRVEVRSGNDQLVTGRNIDWLATGIGIGP
jgi:hypothetical protein